MKMAQQMNNISPEIIAAEIRRLYKTDRSRAESLIENYLDQALEKYPARERLHFLEKIAHCFTPSSPEKHEVGDEPEDFSALFSLLLGKNVPVNGLSSDEILEKLALSLNTVFDTINRIIGLIQKTLLGKEAELDTIRHIIGNEIRKGGDTGSLQNYLDQIRESFLIAHMSFQKSAAHQFSQILNELDPDQITASAKGGLKVGPFLKAESFAMYREKYRHLKNWYESGRFSEELLREFEKNCEKLYNIESRRP